MANWEQVRRLRRGIKGWNQWRAKHPNVKPDLSGASLNGADMIGADMIGANLSGARMIGANMFRANMSEVNMSDAGLNGARMIGANLSGADMSDANLYGANLSDANLSGADMSGANLGETILRNANLYGANLSEALFHSTIFMYVDFRTTKGLATINHLGPSAIHLPSLQLPQDGSALHFLRGIGLTDEQIDAWRITMMHPIQYHSVFISYSNKDETLARRLHADLQDHGVRCWFAPEDMKIGNKIRSCIDEAIHMQDKLLLLLSQHALDSEWIETEVEVALDKEKHQNREVLFPVCLDESVIQATQAWARHLRLKRHIGDFTAWTNPQAYQVAFERLLQDLKKAHE